MPRTNGQILQDALDEAVRAGEAPYKAARHALEDFDIFNDAKAGAGELRAMVPGLEAFAERLERFSNGAEVLARRSLAAVR